MFVFASAAGVDFIFTAFVIDGTNISAWLGKTFTINACHASENERSCLSRPMKI